MTKIEADLLDYASVFLWVAMPSEIEAERRRLEYENSCKIAIFSVEHPSYSSVRGTRVTWQKSN